MNIYTTFCSFLEAYPEKDIDTEWNQVKKKGWITLDKEYCFLCGYSCRSRTTMYTHLQTHPDWVKQLTDIKYRKPYRCCLCDARYTLQRNARRHIHDAHPEIPHQAINQLIRNTECFRESTPSTKLPRTYTLKTYLETECSAIPLYEHIKQVSFSIEDIRVIEWMGVRKGYPLLIKKMLQPYSIQERPIHCTDKKRLTFYVMKETGWTRDHGKRLNTWIDEIKYRLIQCINQWAKQQEQTVSEKATTYIRAVCMGDTLHDETLNKKRIIQSVAPFVYLSKQDLE